jgi:hypothetical protein
MLLAIECAVIICSSIWVAYDAHKNKISIDGKPYSWKNGWLAWLLSCLFLWLAGFPYYIYRRFFKRTIKTSKAYSNSLLLVTLIFGPLICIVFPLFSIVLIVLGGILIYKKEYWIGSAMIGLTAIFWYLGRLIFQ